MIGVLLDDKIAKREAEFAFWQDVLAEALAHREARRQR